MKKWLLLLGLGGGLGALWLALPILGMLVLLGGILSVFGILGLSNAGVHTPQPPPMASALTLPAEWLPYIDRYDPGIPNNLTAAIMAAGSGGKVFGDTYYCTGGHVAPTNCSQAYPPGFLGIGGTAHTLGIARGLLNLRGAPHSPPKNLEAGAGPLARLRSGYLQAALNQFHAQYQAPPGWTTTGSTTATVLQDLSNYNSPVIGAWSLGPWQHGAWQDPHNTAHWVLVVAAAPVGPPWTLTLGPPICTTPPHGGKRVCHPDVLTGNTLELPVAVTAKLSNGKTIYLDPTTKIASVPHWPGAVVWGAKIPYEHGVTLRAYWTTNDVATLNFPNAWHATGGSGPVGTLSASGIWQRWKTLILQTSAATGVPAAWLFAEIVQEGSRGNPTAGTRSGAYGIIQMIKSTAVEYGCNNRGNPACELMAAGRYLVALHRQFGSWRGASAGYYGGPGSEISALRAAGLTPPVPWNLAQSALGVVPFPKAGNTETMAYYANSVYATAQQAAAKYHLPPA